MRPAADSEIHRPRRTLALDHPPTFGTMAAVAAASAELLIIGWYIFRVLLQVSIYPGFGWERAPETRPGTLSPYRDCRPYPTHPIPIAAIPVYQNAAVVLFVPARSVPTSSHRPCPQCARAQPGTKTQGCGGRPLRTIATNAVRNTRYTQARFPGGRRGTCVLRDFTARPTENFHLKKLRNAGNFL